MKHVKVAMALISLVFVLCSCSDLSALHGKWVLSDPPNGCPRSLEFVGDNTMTMLAGGTDSEVTGTLQNVEGDKYKYDVGMISLLMEIHPNDSGDSLLVNEEEHQCHYKKAQ